MFINSVVAVILGLVGLAVAFSIYRNVASQPAGNERMQEIADAIYEGAMAFLKREYQILSIFVLAVFGLLAWKIAVPTGVAFLAGAGCSVLAGYLGMHAATKANVRTTGPCRAIGTRSTTFSTNLRSTLWRSATGWAPSWWPSAWSIAAPGP